jgi:hypothetical protein
MTLHIRTTVVLLLSILQQADGVRGKVWVYVRAESVESFIQGPSALWCCTVQYCTYCIIESLMDEFCTVVYSV